MTIEELYGKFSKLRDTTTNNKFRSYLGTEIKRLELNKFYVEDPDYEQRLINLTNVLVKKWITLVKDEQDLITQLYDALEME